MNSRCLGGALLTLGLALSVTSRGGEERKTILTVKDNDANVKLAKGATLIVRLEGTAGTGFSWTIAKNDKTTLKPLGEPKVKTPDGAKKIGGARVWEFTFQTLDAGISELLLEYKRPFEKDKPAAKSFKAKIEIR